MQSVMQGVRHVCLDIETCNAPEEVVLTAMRFWRPPANIKDEGKIAERRADKEASLREKSALLDGAPIGCVAIVTDMGSAIFSIIRNTPPKLEDIPAEVFAYATEREMLIGMRDWLNARAGQDTAVIGHNCIHFDLPKIRQAYIRHKLQLPLLMNVDGPQVYDTMKQFIRAFTTEHEGDYHVKLAEVQSKLGLQEYKEVISGDKVPGLIAQGVAVPVLAYCWLDTWTTYQAFLAMTGQMPDRPATPPVVPADPTPTTTPKPVPESAPAPALKPEPKPRRKKAAPADPNAIP